MQLPIESTLTDSPRVHNHSTMPELAHIQTRKRCSQRTELRAVLTTTLLSILVLQVGAWGNSDSETLDSSVYGNTLTRDWMSDGSAVSMKLMGCVWGFVKDAEDSGCLERSSEDGTQYWYMMANCRRAQAVFGLYSGTSCSSSNFKETVREKELLFQWNRLSNAHTHTFVTSPRSF